MIWQAVIEINNSRSPYLKEIFRLAKKTALKVKTAGGRLEFVYRKDQASDLEVMLNKVAGWKCTVVYLNKHLIRPRELMRALDCLLYWSTESAQHSVVCGFCPIGGQCEKAVKYRVGKIVSEKEAKDARDRWNPQEKTGPGFPRGAE